MTTFLSLMAQVDASRTYYELMRLRQLDQWWHWLLLAAASLALVFLIGLIYRRDSLQLGLGKRYLLVGLRVLAFVGLLLFVLDLQKRSEQRIVKNSRFAVLIDTSQSMGLADEPGEGEGTREPRIQEVVRTLTDTDWFAALQAKHDVNVYRFDETNQPAELGSFPYRQPSAAPLSDRDAEFAMELQEVHRWWKMAFAFLGVAALALVGHFVLGTWVRTAEGESWALLVGVFLAIVGITFIAISNLRHPSIGMRVALGWDEPETKETDSAAAVADEVGDAPDPRTVAWEQLLEPAGGATRLGDAINWVITRERGAPLAGIALITDGNANRGLDLLAAARAAAAAEVPIFPIGMGSERPPTNVRLVDLEAPLRVYPGDEFKLTGFLQAYGMAGQTCDLRLVSRPDADPNADPVLEAEAEVELAADGAVIPIPLQVTPEAVGKRVYSLEVTGDQVDPDAADNKINAKVQIVDRQSRILLLAGGPTREYRFLRDMLHRDKDTSVDVLLQTASDGISQEADDILFDLPVDPAELYEYDAIVAFDPDWLEFDRAQLELLEGWVAEKAGGLITIAGPVQTSRWAENRRAPGQIEIVRQLYPVTFNSSRIGLGRYGATTAWPLSITKDGSSANFLAVNDDDLDPMDVWNTFPGVYGYYPIRDVKAAATVYARFSDPQVASGDEQPPLIVGQFYGSGRVVFLGTGEFWRLRALDTGNFERFYTKLIRFVSEGRLLRDSNRGLLLVDKDRALRGDTVAVRASVVDQQFQPLQDLSINVAVRRPDATVEQLELARADGGRDGMYAGRFITSQPGDYQLELVLPGDGEPVILEREVRVRLPNLEIERPQRDDAALDQLASKSGGTYFVGMTSSLTPGASLADAVASKRRETFLPGTPDHEFQERLMTWLLVLICGVLSLEWLIRRLNKLA